MYPELNSIARQIARDRPSVSKATVKARLALYAPKDDPRSKARIENIKKMYRREGQCGKDHVFEILFPHRASFVRNSCKGF